jgi:tetratricopeptide (TPR) repeat protein
MLSKILIGISIILIIALAGGSISLFSQNASLKNALNQTKKMANKLENDIASFNKDKETIAQEREKLQADATSYMAINTRVTQEKEKLAEALANARKTLETKEANVERLKNTIKKLEGEIGSREGGGQSDLEAEVKKLKKRIAELDKKAAQDKAVFYYNLGVAYTQAKYYEEAVDCYDKSLELDNTSADAHYNLGLIYGNIKSEPNKALQHYQAYLRLRPDAPDRGDVEGLISKLK